MKKWIFMLLMAIETVAVQSVFAAVDAVSDAFHEFEWQGIKYRVIDDEAKTCMTKPRDNENNSLFPDLYPVFDYYPEVDDVLYIPEKVYDGTHDYVVVEIGDRSFELVSNIVSVTLPNSVIKIGDYAFSICRNLKSLELPETIQTIPTGCVRYCTSLEKLEIPQTVNYIGAYAFDGCKSLKSIIMPSSVICLGTGAFCGCANLTNIVIPDGVVDIKSFTFANCRNLKSIKLPSSLKTIECSAFFKCGLEEIELPESLEVIEDGYEEKMLGCDPEYYGAFAGSGFKRIEFPDNVKKIGEYAFADCCDLEYLKFSKNLREIDSHSCFGCTNLKEVVFPDSLKKIGWCAFEGCKNLKMVEIPEGTEVIDCGAFYDCPNLRKIIIPESLTSMDYVVFGFGDSCESDVEIYYRTSNPKDVAESDRVISDAIYQNGILYIGKGGLDTARRTEPWKNFVNIQEYDFSGVEDVTAYPEITMPIEVFDMQGRKVAESDANLPSGLYIIRQGDKVSKTIK